MGVAHYPTNPLSFERASHTLLHVIEDRLESLLEVGLELFNVRTVVDKILSHSCPSSLMFDGLLFGLPAVE
jgi:hypothetical protein